jgi:ABC-type transport system substrate-binding protein
MPDANEVDRIDPATGRVQARIEATRLDILAFGNGALWGTGLGKLTRIDPATNEVTASADFTPFHFLPTIAFSTDAAWTADETDGSVWKVDRAGTVRGRYQAGAGARPMQYMDGTMWVGNQDDGSVTGIDADTGKITTFTIGHQVGSLAAGDGVLMLGLDRSPEDAIAELEGSVLIVAMTGEPLQQPTPDAAVNFTAYNRMNQYVTCARLLDYPDAPGPAGFELMPEIAASMPEVSADGLTYTFTIRPGFAFSPPSGEAVTAETFRYSIERALSPKLGDRARGMEFLGDVKGAAAFHDAKADHVTGLSVSGNLLSITLTAPASDFLERLALPLFCPVPMGTPIVQDGLDASPPVASAGPYYLSFHGGGELAILKKNPNYGGTRPQIHDAITLRFGLADGETPRRVDDGRAGVAIGDFNLQSGTDLATQWGLGSAAAASGDQRWFPIPYPGIDYLLLNPRQPLLKDPDVRAAIALALDRAAIARALVEAPATQLFSPAFQLRDTEVPELSGPNVEAARDLLAGRRGRIRFGVLASKFCGAACADLANAVKASLAPLGITVVTVEEDDLFAAAADPKEKIDMINSYAQPYYPDPVTLLQQIVVENTPQRLAGARGGRSSEGTCAPHGRGAADHGGGCGPRSRRGCVDHPVRLFARRGLFAADVGCQTIVPGIMNLDLAALCAK